ncbi:MAG: hypothetical protein JWM94_2261, partial [Sphingomonas bacterium]|nr:hypothetical protein [Sphingomonas bacterium]
MKWIMALAALASVAATKAPRIPLPPEGVQTAQPAPVGGYPYQLFLPRGYGVDANQRWPLVIFLHGSGERGTDIELVKKNGP